LFDKALAAEAARAFVLPQYLDALNACRIDKKARLETQPGITRGKTVLAL
jgi:hypothetical protein